ncbi:OmpA family protein [Rubrivivax albus]|uniref:Peptidoglycan-associated lipoprotein n=1 Tax=Rubrivivax albus TaxID=2499835 RepID=A0A437JRV2_9BURK|nr:OmpA family protein [Rubrivivax albus]RVT49663.1 OmpA family protein [Rubrivivax albus]
MTLRPLALPTLIATAALLAACSSPVKLDEPKATTPAPVTQGGTGGSTQTPAQSQATPQSRVATVDLERQRREAEAAAAAQAAAAMANLPRVLYFDFDSFLLRAEDKPVLEGYAKALVAQRDRKLSLQGHADERGGREYNLALGQKRAEAVARAMELLGVQAGQVEAVSFGEERPADPASNEAAWAKNRRVEIKDR